MKIRAEIFKAKNGQYAYRLIHKNGNKLTASETYTRKSNAIKSLNRLLTAIKEGQCELVDLTKKK